MRKMQLYVNCQKLRCSDNMKKIFAFFVALLIPQCLWALQLPQILTAVDASLYQQIFILQDMEKINTAINVQTQIANDLLMNEVLFQRYISDTYHTRGREVSAWMDKYYDMPGAKRMEKLAKIKQTTVRKASVPNMISGSESIETAQSENWTEKKYSGNAGNKINDFKRAIRSGSSKVARQILEDKNFKKGLTESDYGRLSGRLSYLYYTNGEMELAKKWGFIASDANSEYGLWAMGLLYFKEENYIESQKYFSRILELPQINNARKTEAAFWAGRAADFKGDRESAKRYWRIAATYPMAFYGALSATMLGHQPQYEFFENEATDEDVAELMNTKYGKMALALLQIGRKDRAEEYLKYLITPKVSDRTLHAVNSIASEYGLPRVSIQSASVIKDRGILDIEPNK